MTDVVRALDRFQRRHRVLGFPIAVIYKFFDDQGNYLAAALAYYGFISIFPLLLLASSILGFVLQGNPEWQERVLDSALSQFPIIGDQLGRQEGLSGSTTGIIVGALAALYGSMGLGQAIQNTMNTAWSVPRNSRPNPILLRVKSLVLLATAGLAVVGVSVISILGSDAEIFSPAANSAIRWLIRLASIVIVGIMLTILFTMATARDHPLRSAAPGAFTLAVAWQLLQQIGTTYVERVINVTEGMNKTFALVLGLVGFLYLMAMAGIIGIEVNVVLVRRLWPRALLTPFTDKVDLTDADRRAYASYVLMQRHKGFETVAVSFEGRDGDTHEIIMDPTWARRQGKQKAQIDDVHGHTGEIET